LSDEGSRERIRDRVARSRGARVAAFPIRARSVAAYDARVVGRSIRWLATSREHTNLTYDLSELNWTHLAWFVSEVAGVSVGEARRFIDEGRSDIELSAHVRRLTQESDRRGLADLDVRMGRRLGWYALARILRPKLVIETGTDKGLGSVALAQALRRNESGRLVSIDINPNAGYLTRGYEGVVELVTADSAAWLASSHEPIDLFIHDSLHTRDYETSELEAIANRLSAGAVVLSDNSHVTDALPTWAESCGRRFLHFQEVPRDHWYPGGGIGASWRGSDD